MPKVNNAKQTPSPCPDADRPMQTDSLKKVLIAAHNAGDHALWTVVAKELILFTDPFCGAARKQVGALLASGIVALRYPRDISLGSRAAISEIAGYIPFWQLSNALQAQPSCNRSFLSVLATMPSAHPLLARIFADDALAQQREGREGLVTTISGADSYDSAYRKAVGLFRTNHGFSWPASENGPFGAMIGSFGRAARHFVTGLVSNILTGSSGDREEFGRLFHALVDAETLPRALRPAIRRCIARRFSRSALPRIRGTEQRELALVIARQIRTGALMQVYRDRGSAALVEWLLDNPLAHSLVRQLSRRRDPGAFANGAAVAMQGLGPNRRADSPSLPALLHYLAEDNAAFHVLAQRWTANDQSSGQSGSSAATPGTQAELHVVNGWLTGVLQRHVMDERIVRQNVHYYRALSDHQLATGDVVSACTVREWIARTTNFLTDHHRHLNAIFATGAFHAAAQQCERMKQRFPDFPAFWKKAGQVCERLRDYEGMLYNFTELSALEPDGETARAAIARALIYLDRKDAAFDWLRRCGTDRDESLWTHVMRAFLAARLGDSVAAQAALDIVYGRCRDVMARQRDGLKGDPAYTYLLNGLQISHPSAIAPQVYKNFSTWLAILEKGSIALIGNSPALLKRGLGSQIDGFDAVIRLNDFVIEGYEADLGTKTDFWYSSANRQAMPHRPSVVQAKTILMQPQARHFPDIAAFSKGRLGFELDPRESSYLPPCVKMMSEHLSYAFPSTGLRMIQILEFLFQQPFTAYGFDFFSAGEMHYFDRGETHLQVGEAHAIDFERDLVAQLLLPFGRHIAPDSRGTAQPGS